MNIKKSLRSFTLIEMMVVISIIAILIAMIIPNLSKAKEKANEAKCRDNLRQLQTGALGHLYSSSDSRLPYSKSWQIWNPGGTNSRLERGWVDWFPTNTSAALPAGSGWDGPLGGNRYYSEVRWWGNNGIKAIERGTLWAQVNSLRMFVCPTFDSIIKRRYNNAPDGSVYNKTNTIVRSYAMNSQASRATLGGTPSQRLLFADMSETNYLGAVRICERSCVQNPGGAADNKWNWDGELDGTKSGANPWPVESIGTYHTGRGNAVFMDGHVESLLWTQTTNACAASW